MKVKIEIDPALAEDEVLIRCRKMDEHILRLQQEISQTAPEKNCIALQDAGTSYFVPLDEILFFETEGKHIQAHTASRLYLTERKLYELEETLPGSFMRIQSHNFPPYIKGGDNFLSPHRITYYFSFTRSFKAFPALNFGDFDA